MNLLIATVIVATLTVYAQATDVDPFYEVLSSWPGHFRANFCLTAPQDLYKWKLNITFVEPVTSLQIARVKVLSNSEDQKTWLMKSEDHNAVWLQTQRGCFDFIGSRQGLTDGVDAEVAFQKLRQLKECPEQVEGQQFTQNISVHWQHGISGSFCLRVPRDFNGDWTIMMEFDRRGVVGLQVPEAGEVTQLNKSGKKWLQTPTTQNGQQREGDNFCQRLTILTGDWMMPCIRAFFTERDQSTPITVSLPPADLSETIDSVVTLPADTAAPATTPELGSVYTEKHLWEEGVNGELCLFRPVDVDCGWEAGFLFQPAIDRIEIWRAAVADVSQLDGGTLVSLTNMPWNAALWGNPECLDFNAFKSYPEAPSEITGQFTRVCSGGVFKELPWEAGLIPTFSTEGPTTEDPTTAMGSNA